jgi:hypothetical protein
VQSLFGLGWLFSGRLSRHFLADFSQIFSEGQIYSKHLELRMRKPRSAGGVLREQVSLAGAARALTRTTGIDKSCCSLGKLCPTRSPDPKVRAT